LSRYFRNLLVARIAGSDTRLIAASKAERARFAEMSAAFSEEDLTRYLQLSLDLFRDLQFSLQPRFHLEIGLLKLVQAGKLVAIEEALAGLKGDAEKGKRGDAAPKTGATALANPKSQIPTGPPAPARPSPFELDRAKKASRPEPQSMAASVGATALAPEPAPADEAVTNWRETLHAALVEFGLTFTADAVEHSEVTQAGNVLQFVTPKDLMLAMRTEDLSKAVQRVSARPFKITVTAGEAAPARGIALGGQKPDEVAQRALANPEVQRFREVFGGEVRAVRDLKRVE
jgi:DNA polymerase-3 subunit gamma/tau